MSAPRSGQPGYPPFPTWPPPNGGAPFIARFETGPIAGTPPPGTTFPAGAALGQWGAFVNPQTWAYVKTVGGPL